MSRKEHQICVCRCNCNTDFACVASERAFPSLCKTLRNQRVTYIACGEDHTAALTLEGGLFTFGSGSYGQLGHGSKTHEMLPRRVMELMGSDVTQIACGRYTEVCILIFPL